MIGEGRSYAAAYMDSLGGIIPGGAKYCAEAAKYFRLAAQCIWKMNEPKGGFTQTEEVTENSRRGMSADRLQP